MRNSLLLALSSVALLAACNPISGNVGDGDSSSSEDHSMHDMSSSSAASSVAPSSVTPPSADTRVIEMTADDWTFSPSTITAKKGEKVVVRVTGVKGKHSFAIEELGINVPIEAGETKDIVIPTDTAGTFSFRCRIPCGPGHKEMVGSIIIS